MVMRKFTILCLMLFSFFTIADENGQQKEQCVIQQTHADAHFTLLLGEQSKATIPTGQSRFIIRCDLQHDAVVTFLKSELIHFEWRQNGKLKKPLQAIQPAYFVPEGNFEAELTFITHHTYTPYFEWLSVESFIANSQKNNLIMGCFYGLCLTLIFYVLILGRSLKDKTFKLYSAYISCAGLFFLLQEGQLSLFLASQSFWLSHQLYLVSAGLTVFSASVFIVRLTYLRKRWPRLINWLLLPSAWLVLILSIIITLQNHNTLSSYLGSLMAYITLAIVVVILGLVGMQAYKKVPDTLLVFVALSFVMVAMVFRVLFPDINPMINRYGLIFAFAFESFLLAVAVSERVKRLKKDKNMAETEANYDQLCDVFSRRGWLKHAQHLLEQHKHKGGILGLLYIDLNGFKQVNDTYGHSAGDKVLQVLCKIVAHKIRQNDVLGRLGGDEFVVLGLFADSTEFQLLQQRVQARLEKVVVHTEEVNIPISASVGSVSFFAIPDDISELLKEGDKAMYREKLNHYEQNKVI